jgi:hypothetical protein
LPIIKAQFSIIFTDGSEIGTELLLANQNVQKLNRGTTRSVIPVADSTRHISGGLFEKVQEDRKGVSEEMKGEQVSPPVKIGVQAEGLENRTAFLAEVLNNKR